MRRYPIVEEITTGLTPAEAFELFRLEPRAFFLDSGMDPQRLGRYSFMGSRPFLTLTSRDSRITLDWTDRTEIESADPFDTLERLLGRFRLEARDLPAPFATGAVGYLSYDLCHFIEKLPQRAKNDIPLPECSLAFYATVLAFDLLEGKTYIVASGFPEENEEGRLAAAREEVARLKSRLAGMPSSSSGGAPRGSPLHPRPTLPPQGGGEHGEEGLPLHGGGELGEEGPPLHGGGEHEERGLPFQGGGGQGGLRCNFTHEDYVRAVARAREYICAGDIYQVNLSQRFETGLTGPPYALYQKLRSINPAPFAAFLDLGGGQAVISASPERFLKLTGDRVETRPIKGTRPRGRTPREDQALAQELLDSAKDRAENIMIVDLERNDLGRVCRYGSVKVTELAVLESFPTVFHLTSTITGWLSPGKNGIDLLRATFPGGSITGAPKVRAMEIIDELEPTRRSVYTGALGYLGFDGDIDLNIVIRTILVSGGKALFQVGGGIVYDSEPEAEYQETLDKGRALARALGMSLD